MSVDLFKLQYFATLARTGNFARAAEELRISQPALTRSIQGLERHYGVRLVERVRGRRGVVLTTAGRTLVRESGSVLASVEGLEAAMETGRSTLQARLGFGIGPIMASVMLRGPLADFVTRYPTVEVVALVSSNTAMMRALLQGEVEFYLGRSPGGSLSPRVREVTLGQPGRRVRMWVRDGHPLLERGEELAGADIAEFPRVSGYSVRDYVRAIEDDSARAAFLPTVEVDSLTAQVELAQDTDAVLVSGVRTGVQGTLIQLPFVADIDQIPSQPSMFRLDGVPLTPLATEMLDQLRAAYAAEFEPTTAEISPAGA